METLVLIGVLAATVLVMASGVWVAWALIGAVWHVNRREDVPPAKLGPNALDAGKNTD